jgi:phosphopantothenoylcysteine decarboxylase/phosphopantothenate--cysteine ligase
LAEVAARLGAQVTLVSAAAREVALDVRREIRVVAVESAAQMAAAMFENFATADVAIMAAAVADFTFDPSPSKLKKEAGLPVLTPVATVDIVAELAARRTPGQLVVAFAAETEDLEARALDKFARKGVDLLVANDVSQPHAGFAHPTNEVLIVGRDASVEKLSLRSKEAISQEIMAKVASLLSQGVP